MRALPLVSDPAPAPHPAPRSAAHERASSERPHIPAPDAAPAGPRRAAGARALPPRRFSPRNRPGLPLPPRSFFMLMAYASVAAFFLVAIGFILGSLLAGKLHPARTTSTPRSSRPTSAARRPSGPAWFNFNPRFYIIALIYIVFDVEIAFIYPVATVFKRWVDQGSGALRARRDLRLRRHPDARPRLRVGEGRSRVDPLDQGRPARHAERDEPHDGPRRCPSRRRCRRGRARRARPAAKEPSDGLEPEPDGPPEGAGTTKLHRRRRQRHHHATSTRWSTGSSTGAARTASGTCSSASPAARSS